MATLTQEQAEAGREALVAAGVPEADVVLQAQARGVEGAFLWRAVVLIALWSVAGGAIGAAIGAGLWALGIGPGGTTGLIIQVASWAIFWHLIVGMWAGYALLADRSHPEMAPDRDASRAARLTVRCPDQQRAEELRGLLREYGATEPGEGGNRSGPTDV